MKTPGGDSPQIEVSESFQPAYRHTPWPIEPDDYARIYEKKKKRQFEVVRLEDPRLIEDLQTEGVEYRGRLENNWLQNFSLNWLIPLAIMFMA